MMSNNEIDNVLEPTAVVDKIKSPTLDHLTCQLTAEVPGDQQQNFPCTSTNIRPTERKRTKNASPYVAMRNAPRKLLTSHRRLIMDIKSCCSALSLRGSHKSLELESINYCSLKLAVKKFFDRSC